jgi:hypothetical protein
MTGEATWYVFYSTEEAPSASLYLQERGMSPEDYYSGWFYGMGSGVLNAYNEAPYIVKRPFDNDKRHVMTWVKYETPTLESGETGTIQWSVFLK